MDAFEKYKVASLPATAYYIPDFITKDEEELLISQIGKTPGPKWTQLSKRRLQNWGGIPHPKGMIAEKIPDWLQKSVIKANKLGVFDEKLANHVLLNEYLPGQGIMPHLDGPLFYPTIATLSLGSHCVEHFYSQAEEEGEATHKQFEERIVASLLVEPRSLLILKDDMYHKFLHGIEEISEDCLSENVVNVNPSDIDSVKQRTTRISLTIRHVPKTSKMKLLLGKK